MTSRTLPGKPVVYFTAAGNDLGAGYASNFQYVSPSAAKRLSTPVKLSTIPSKIDVSGGFHNFNPNGSVDIAQQLIVQGQAIITFQWTTSSIAAASPPTTTYWSSTATGNYVSSISSTDNNFSDR